MTTDEMILALVATGKFTLPSLVEVEDGRLTTKEAALFPDEDEARQLHDLCAMHFARGAENVGFWREALHGEFRLGYSAWASAVIEGNSAAAIKALWEALN